MKNLIVVCFVSCWISAHGWFIFSSGSGRQEAEGEIKQECMEKALVGDCQFYVCFDQRHPCERNNYALRYGWRFCDKFNNKYNDFTREAQRWINATRVCSMTKMIEFYQDDHINCHDVEHEMNNNHAECEAEHGVCNHDMLMENKDLLMGIYPFGTKSANRFLKVVKECGVTIGTDFLSWMNDQRKSVVSFFESLKDKIANLDEDFKVLKESLPDIDLPDLDINWDDIERLPNLN